MIVLWDRDSGSWLLVFYFSSIFCLSPNYKLTLKIGVRVFSGTFKARMLKLCIHMDNEKLYCGIKNQTPGSYSSLYLSIFLSFKAKFVSQFSPELCKLESSNMAYICRLSDCIMGLRLRDIGCYFSIFIHFSFFPYITC